MWVTRTQSDVRAIARHLGMLVVGMGILMCLPLITALALAEWAPALDYFASIGITLAIGTALVLAAPAGAKLTPTNALILTALGWLVAALVGAIPLLFSGSYGSYLDSVFETMSGLTTSGLFLARDLDHMSLAHNMWRHLTHLLGGQGIVVAALSFAFAQGGGAVSLYLAEGREERILPNVMHTARFIWFVTAVYVAIGTLALSVVNIVRGMSIVRGSLHAFWLTIAAYDTGGFGPMSQNTLYYHSGWLEAITVVLMIAGTLNFNLHARIWRGDRRELFENIESRVLAGNIAILCLLVSLGLAVTPYLGEGSEIIRKGIYHIFSANSGTGHQSIYPAQWVADFGGLGFAAVVLAMAFGGMVCSTAGGIKALRVGLIVKGIIHRIKQSLAPGSAVIATRYHHISDHRLDPELLARALMVFVLYIVTYITGALIGAAYGYGAGVSLFESVSAAANVGLSTGITTPTMPVGLKITYIVQMWAGRLEFVALFALVASLLVPVKRRLSR